MITFDDFVQTYDLKNKAISTRKWHSESADPAKAIDLSLAKQTNRQTKNFGHTEVRTLDPPGFSTMLLPTELWGRTYVITLIRLLLSDYYYQINKKFWPHRGSNTRPSRF